MGTKEQFIEYMRQFQNQCDLNYEEYQKVKDAITVDWICDIAARHDLLIINLIEKLFDFKDDWIGWFCLENDFGRKKLTCSKKDGPDIQITNAGELWDFLKID